MIDLRVAPVKRGQPFDISVNGMPVRAYPGETVAGALLAAGMNVFRKTRETGRERGQFCGMGVCYDCLVDVDGQRSQRACMTACKPGMTIEIPALSKDRAE
ncbi:(2Fe-2S)-binding protein [Shinella sp.]|uniref:(2Fe-2S)-binding protein n=1 Tax=Shinella sp. TaxID=1870904 RepID=UPI002587D80F|nr:(2Fe-2S)-binding protein [Shinella sp.]MCW5707782.1 (2Fe-2S)-binding protein [Shinella sp.]